MKTKVANWIMVAAVAVALSATLLIAAAPDDRQRPADPAPSSRQRPDPAGPDGQRGPNDRRDPAGDRQGRGDRQAPGGPGAGGMAKFELGRVVPPFLLEQLNLSDDQRKQLDALEKDVKARLEKLLNDDQKKVLENLPGRPGGFGGPGGPGGPGQAGPDVRPNGAGGRPDGDRGPRPDGDRGLRPDGDRGPGPGGLGGPDGQPPRLDGAADGQRRGNRPGAANGQARQPNRPGGLGAVPGTGDGFFKQPDHQADPNAATASLVPNRFLRASGANATAPDGFTLEGDAAFGDLSGLGREAIGVGVRLLCGADSNHDGSLAGAVSYMVKDLKPQQGRWYRLTVRGLAQDGVRVEKDELFLRAEFFKDNGTNALGDARKSIYEQVEADRKNLKDPDTNKNLGSATWRSYVFDFHTPFAEIDAVRLSAGFAYGVSEEKNSEFWITEFDLTSIPAPADYTSPSQAQPDANPPSIEKLVKLGGRWYYDPRGSTGLAAGGGDRKAPKQIDYTNAERLWYLSDRLETPFADQMSAWLRKGYIDQSGKMVDQDRFIPDSAVITFTDKSLVMHTRDLPNHPTAVFPDRWRLLDGNPASIQEQDMTISLPLEPKESANRVAMNARNANNALGLGVTGVAANGVIFYNPFDLGDEEAIWRLDRCCGHPSPRQQYHYHKYPTCLNTPWSDDGKGHSPVLGFALDGYAIYGPYEAAGETAKDSKSNSLNAFNIHKDEKRGWHYHVTPGKFPHVIGGFWGEPTLVRMGRGPR